ncbi:multidrug effflux MFS transporter [Prosthecomicrobium sp. N25]|uniref:multidrug effflux MFS transporter n=1 Tax=Prosthecomicrobium sp. N25 TaxID=3129254 RepID=UPI00307868C5
MTVIAATGPAPARRPPLLVLIAASAVNPLALNMFVPSMPGMEAAFHTTYAKVQLALSLYLAAVAVAQLVLGPLSDRFGRRPVMIAGLTLFVVGTLVCRFAPTIEMLIAGRVVQGAGSCTGLVLTRAIVRDLYDRNQAASMIGLVTMGMAVAPALGPAIGGYLDELHGWTATFDLLLGFGLLVTLASWRYLTETNRDPQSGGGIGALAGSIVTLMRIPMFRVFAFTCTFSSAIFFTYIGGAPYVAQKLMGVGTREIGFWFMLIAVGYVIGNFGSARYAGRFGVLRMMLVGNLGGVAACAAMALLFWVGVMHPIAIFGPVFVLGIANGIALPSTMSSGVSVRPDLAGAASGLIGSMQVGGGALATVVVGALLEDTPWPLVLAMLTLSVLALLTGLLARRDRS